MTELRNIVDKNIPVFQIFPNTGGSPIAFNGGVV
jgi:hypothetical protein